MKNDLVSIITPAFNSERTISETIESVLAQTHQEWEMIIVDDCSEDGTRDIVKRFAEKDERIKLVELKMNSGVANARNVAIRKATGRYIAFLDSDDLWEAEKLLKQISFMLKKKCSFSYTAYEIVDAEGNSLKKTVFATEKQDYKKLLKQNTIGCLTVMIDRVEISNIEMPLMKHEDFATWLDILKEGYVAYGLNESLGKYRKLDDSVSANKFKTIGWVWKIYREHQNLGYFRSSYYLIHFVTRSALKYKQLDLLSTVLMK